MPSLVSNVAEENAQLIGKLIVLLSVYSQANEAIVLPELGTVRQG